MSRRGENIRKRKDGRWEARYSYLDQETGQRKTKSLYAPKYSEAKEKLYLFKESLSGLENLKKEKNQDVILDQAAEKWLENVKKEKKYSTYIKYRNIYVKYLQSFFGSEKLLTLSEKKQEEFESGFPRTSESVKKSVYSVLNQIFSYSREYYNLDLKKFSCPRRRIMNMPVITLTNAEQEKLLKHLFIDMNSYKLGILLSLYTGLRLGEICALAWGDIDMNAKILYVNRTVQRIAVSDQVAKTSLREDEPKSVFSKRIIPLPDAIVPHLQHFYKEDGYIITPGKPTEPRTLQYQFKKILSEAEISEHNFHILRHTFATNCIAAGADIKSISEILGHANVNITLNRYVHPTESIKRMHLNSLASIYGQFTGQK